ncbi:MAG: ABC transporter permease [Phycisphaerales bacterium JB039]
MWTYVLRRTLYNIPIFLGIILILMALLRINDPVYAQLSKNATVDEIEQKRIELGTDRPFLVQYGEFLLDIVTFDFSDRSWYAESLTVGQVIGPSIVPSLAITLPALALSATLSIGIGLISAAHRGRLVDRTLVLLAVLGMSVSFLVFIILGQYFGAYWLSQELGIELFAVQGYEGYGAANLPVNWAHYCLLPVLISVVVTMGYDTRFYRSVIVEQTGADYIRTARAKGCSQRQIMLKHLLRNALIPIITRIMITLPFVVVGSLLLEVYFGIPGMGRTLYTHIINKDFPVTQAIVALLAAIFIATNILTDVLYALVDPRVRLS